MLACPKGKCRNECERQSVRAVADTQAVMTTHLAITGPFDLREIALMGFGHRDERSFDGVMRMAFCLDGNYERQVGVEARQARDRLELLAQAIGDQLSDAEADAVRKQVARVVSLDHDGEAFHQLCLADPVLSRVHVRAPGFRPALFNSPYEAALWSIISARRTRTQAITLRTRMSEQYGARFELSGSSTVCVPTPSAVLQIESLPGLPADRIPRLHAMPRPPTVVSWTHSGYVRCCLRTRRRSCNSCQASVRSTAR
jgi:DNA-3-methyladenine glycosylase II